MADRYPTRPGAPNPPNHESDPLAELARLIGQTDPFANFGRANPQQQTPDPYHDPYGGQEHDQEQGYQQGHEPTFDPEPYPEEPQVEDNRPAWLRKMQGHQQPAPEPRYAEPPHQPAPQPAAPPWPQRPGTARAPDPARYNDVLFGQAQAAPSAWPAAGGPHAGYPEQGGSQPYDSQQYPPQQYGEQQYDQSYEQDAYPYQAEDDEPVDIQRRNGGLLTAIVVASLAVVGTASAFGYRYYHGGYSRSGDAPIIYADKGPTKITPATTADASGKFNDRVGDNGEKIVPREEQPVNVQPRVVFPAPNQSVATGVATSGAPTSPIPVAPSIAAAVQNSQQASADPGQPAGNGAMDEPKKIKVLTIHGDNSTAPPTPSMMPPIPSVPAPASAPPKRVATTAPAAAIQPPARATISAPAAGGGPLSLSPNAATAPAPSTRSQVANIAPTAPSAGGGYVVQVSSQRNEADAQNSYRAMQSKYPSVLGSRSPFIKRVDLGDKGVYYRAMVGPFASSEEAGQFCGDLKSAGGQCVVQRN